MDLKWKKASCHIKLLFLTYLELRKNLSALEKWPSGWRPVGGINIALVCWVRRGHIILVHVAIHFT
jgi:hypothetical protein